MARFSGDPPHQPTHLALFGSNRLFMGAIRLESRVMCSEKAAVNEALPVGPVDSFLDLDLSDDMLSALKAANYDAPTPIQSGLIPLALDERDVVGQARTGTGKTAAFVIPILELIHLDHRSKMPQALILVPTRELAVQVRDEVVKLGARPKSALRRHLRRHTAARANRKVRAGRGDCRRHSGACA